MKSKREKAMRLWVESYGDALFAEDFDGGLMYREAYGDRDYYIIENMQKIYCGWNIHHILPVACGGTNEMCNLICTNILTNEAAGNRTTFWIDETLYQVRKTRESGNYNIIKIGEFEYV